MRQGLLSLVVVVGVGCTSITVRPVQSPPPLRYVCIRDNPKVIVDDFVPVLRDVLSERGIRSEIVSDTTPSHCDAVLTYTARRSWDLAPYLSHAEVRLERDGLQIGYAEYHLRGGGGFSLLKWRGTRAKMEKVFEELFANAGP